MKIGIISNCDQFIPLAYTLANNGLQVCIYFMPGEDVLSYQKVQAFVQATKIAYQEGDVYQWLHQTKPDVVFVYGYKYLLDVQQFSQPVFNIHPGPLPSFRGPVPVFWQLKKGMTQLGMCIHVLSAKFDAGTVVWRKSIPDQPHYNYALVHQVFSQVVVEGVGFILRALSAKLPLPAITSDMPAAYHKKPGAADIMIDWVNMSGVDICNLVRACNPWNKGASTSLNGQEVKLMDARIVNDSSTLAAGTISDTGDHLLIATKDQQLLQVNMLQLYDAFVPAYQAASYGIVKGIKLGAS